MEGLVRHGEALHGRHLGAAVGHDDKLFLAVFQRFIDQFRKCCADTAAKIALALAVRVGACFVFGHPRQILRVLLHMDEFLPLEAAEVHLLQPFHRHELRFREEDLRRLGSALQRGHIDDFRGKIGPPQLRGTLRRKRDVPLALIAFLGVVFGSAMTQQIDQHGAFSFFRVFPHHYSLFALKSQGCIEWRCGHA